MTSTYATLRGIYFLDDSTGFYCGSGGIIGKTTDGGTTWVNDSYSPNWLRDFDFPTKKLGYCIGDVGYILKTSNGGLSWQLINNDYGWTNFVELFFLNPDTGYVSGLHGAIVKTTDGGLNWELLETGTNVNLYGLFFFNALEGYVVGNEGTILQTADGGETWIPVESNSESTLRAIEFIDEERAFISGYNGTLLKRVKVPQAYFGYEIEELEASFTDSSECLQYEAYLWDFGDGINSDLKNPQHTYDCSGTYEVCLVITNWEAVSDTFCQSLIVVSDQIFPEISCPPDVPVECTGDIPPRLVDLDGFTAFGGMASDNVGIEHFTVSEMVSGENPRIITRVYTVIDSAGNASSCSQVITQSDEESPFISCMQDQVIECIDSLQPSPLSLADFLIAGGSVSDNCGIESYSITEGSVGDCPRMTMRIFSISDSSGNSASCQQVISQTAPDAPQNEEMYISPNPNFGTCVLENPSFQDISILILYNPLGQEIDKLTVNGSPGRINLSIPTVPGTYLLKVSTVKHGPKIFKITVIY